MGRREDKSEVPCVILIGLQCYFQVCAHLYCRAVQPVLPSVNLTTHEPLIIFVTHHDYNYLSDFTV